MSERKPRLFLRYSRHDVYDPLDDMPHVPPARPPRCRCGSELRANLTCSCGAVYERHANGRVLTRRAG